jgi:hypothetical protein
MGRKSISVSFMSFFLHLGFTQLNAATKPMIFWLDYMGTVYGSNSDGSNRQILVSGTAQGLNDPDGVAVDTSTGKIYWSNMADGNPNGSLQRANLDGTGIEYVVKPAETHTPKQIQLDVVHGKIYWSDRDGLKIQRSNLDGSANEVLVSGLKNPVGMELDIAKGYFYWSDRNAGTINRAHFSMPAGQTATNRKDIDTLISGLTRPIDLGLDIPRGQIYWTDRDEGTVHRAFIEIPSGKSSGNRTDIETVLRNLATPIGISLDLNGGKLYFTELPGKVGRANLDGTGAETLWQKTGVSSFTGIVFVQVPIKSSSILRAPYAKGSSLGTGISKNKVAEALRKIVDVLGRPEYEYSAFHLR